MKEILRLSSKEWETNSLTVFIRNAEDLRNKHGADEIYFWPEIYEYPDIDNLDPEDILNTKNIREPIIVFGIKE